MMSTSQPCKRGSGFGQLLPCLSTGAVITAALVSGAAHAQDYPTRPMRIIAPFGAGGGGDVSLRMLSGLLAKNFGQADVREAFVKAGFEPRTLSPEATDAFVRAERDKWAQRVKAAGIEPQ